MDHIPWTLRDYRSTLVGTLPPGPPPAYTFVHKCGVLCGKPRCEQNYFEVIFRVGHDFVGFHAGLN